MSRDIRPSSAPLLPCPFCGGTQDENGVIDHDKKCFVILLIDAFMIGAGSIEEVEKAWNTRADDRSQAAAYWQRAHEETVRERTCKLIPTRGKKYRPHVPTLTCSNCGAVYELSEANPSETLYGFAYCQSCGAKVVE